MPARLTASLLLVGLIVATPRPADAAAVPPIRRDSLGDLLPPGAVARLGTTRLRHADGFDLSCALFSPNSRLIATGGVFGIHLWDAVTGKELRTLAAPFEGDRTGLAFSPDSSLLVAGVSADGNNLFVWNVTTGALLRTLAGHRGQTLATAFVDGGKTLVSVGSDGKVCWWRLATGKRLREWDPVAAGRSANAPVRFSAFHAATLSPDGKALAVYVGWERSDKSGAPVAGYPLTLWDLAGRKEVWRTEEKRSWAGEPAFSPDGKRLAFSGDAAGPTVYDAATGKPWKRFALPDVETNPWEGNPHNIHHVAVSADGKTVALAIRGFGVRFRDLHTGKALRKLCPPLAPEQMATTGCAYVALSADGKRTLLLWHRKIWLWDSAGRQILGDVGHCHDVDELLFSADGKQLLSSSWVAQWRRYGREGILWDARTWKQRARWEASPMQRDLPVPCSPDHRLEVRRVGKEGDLWVCERGGGKRLCKLDLRSRDDIHYGGYFSPNNHLLTMPVPGADGAYHLLDAASGKCLGKLKVGRSYPHFTFSPDDKFVAWCDDDGDVIHVVDVAGKEKKRLIVPPGKGHSGNPEPVLSFSPDGRYLASWRIKDNDVHIWDVVRGKEHRRLAGKGASRYFGLAICLAWSPDGRTIAVGGMAAESDIQLWEVETEQQRRVLTGHGWLVKALAFSPDGRLLASGGADATVLVWDLLGSPGGRLALLWTALAGTAAEADRAVRALTADPKRAVPFLRARLRPVEPPSPELARGMMHWLKELGNEKFAVRRQAAEELQKLGGAAEQALRQALERRPSAEVRRQLLRLLDKAESLPLPAEQRQAVRAVEALEHIGTEESRQLLRVLAGGAPAARLSQEAEAALKRLARRTAQQ